jgi:hypothetical protein
MSVAAKGYIQIAWDVHTAVHNRQPTDPPNTEHWVGITNKETQFTSQRILTTPAYQLQAFL